MGEKRSIEEVEPTKEEDNEVVKKMKQVDTDLVNDVISGGIVYLVENCEMSLEHTGKVLKDTSFIYKIVEGHLDKLNKKTEDFDISIFIEIDHIFVDVLDNKCKTLAHLTIPYKTEVTLDYTELSWTTKS